MQYVRSIPNTSGAYPGPQSNPFPGALALSDEQATLLLAYNGFVSLTVEGGTVTAVTPNTAAWEAWKASLPAPANPEPTAEEIALDLLAEHEERLCMLELTAAE